jgi:hypothetical protein
MQRAKWLSIVLGLLLVMGLAFVVTAQDDTTEEPPETTMTPEATDMMDDNSDDAPVDVNTIIPEGGVGLLTTLQGSQFVTGFQGAVPLNARVLGVAYLTGFDTYSFDLSTVRGLNMGTNMSVAAEATADPSMAAFADCGLVRVYKVSSQGSQDIWPNVSCTGSTLSIVAGGDGHYILYAFASVNAVTTAPETLSTCVGAFTSTTMEMTAEADATAEAGVTTDSILLGDQTCWNFSAISGATTAGTVVATAPAPTTDDSNDDDNDDEMTPEATVETTEIP